MIQTIIHTTEWNNFYLYDDSRRLSALIHPELIKVYQKSHDVDSYYLRKYEYLTKHGFFTQSKPIQFGEIEESTVENSVAQTQQIVFEVTDECNLNCTYCGYGELYEGYGVRNIRKINTQSAINLLKHVFCLKSKENKTNLNIGFYGGEPLLNIGFVKEVVEEVNQLKLDSKIEITFSMTTNATLLHKHIDFLVTNKFCLLISLDGNEENQSYRIFSKNKKNSFLKVVENIDALQRDYPEYFAGQVRFNAVLHNRNSVKEIYEFIYTRYNKIPRISELALNDVKLDKKTPCLICFVVKVSVKSNIKRLNLICCRKNIMSYLCIKT